MSVAGCAGIMQDSVFRPTACKYIAFYVNSMLSDQGTLKLHEEGSELPLSGFHQPNGL